MSSEFVISTYVRHGDKHFNVSTIERDSSVVGDSSRYNETIVWVWDEVNRERKEIIFQDEDGKGSIRVHQRIVERIFTTGNPEEEVE